MEHQIACINFILAMEHQTIYIYCLDEHCLVSGYYLEIFTRSVFVKFNKKYIMIITHMANIKSLEEKKIKF